MVEEIKSQIVGAKVKTLSPLVSEIKHKINKVREWRPSTIKEPDSYKFVNYPRLAMTSKQILELNPTTRIALKILSHVKETTPLEEEYMKEHDLFKRFHSFTGHKNQ